ncbi:MAG: putative peptidoglycan glycosyltransferase FtsW [Minisyncoccia bacterium]
MSFFTIGMNRARLKPVDKYLATLLTLLVVGGYIIFNSASLGLLAKSGNQFSNVAFTQTFFGLFLGALACILISRWDYKLFKKYAYPILFLGFVLTALVFIPHVGFAHGGAVRWIQIGSFTFQPSEILKIAVIIFLSAWYSVKKGSAETFNKGTLPLIIILVATGAILLAQPDTDNFFVTVFGALGVYLAAGGRVKHVIAMGLIGVLLLTVLAIQRPYIRARLNIFANPNTNVLGSGYQAKQSLIAVGSGGLTGRGFGKSIQKFTYLPEPIGDSIFAVASEEFGFVGASVIILIFVLFSMRCLRVAAHTEDTFGRLLVVGIVILLISQAFLNIGAMLGVLPLTGITLPFVSHGASSLLVVLAEMGIVLAVSRKTT